MKNQIINPILKKKEMQILDINTVKICQKQENWMKKKKREREWSAESF